MKKYLDKIIFISLIIFLISLFSYSKKAVAISWSLVVGAGELYNPSSYRVGIETWEVGVLNSRTFGVIKNVPIGNFYYSFGPAFVSNSFGLFGAAGLNYTFYDYFYIKGELNASRSITNYGIGTMMVGLGVAW